MTDKKDEPIIELTEVVEEAPEDSGRSWMENSPPPAPQKRGLEPPPVLPKEDAPGLGDVLKGIPDSPLKKFILSEEEAPVKITPPAKAPLVPPFPPQPPRIFPEPGKSADAPRVKFPEGPKPAPERPPMPPEPGHGHSAPEPPKPPVMDVEAELRIIREAMLSRVERWVSQEGVQALERVAREIFPKIAEEILRREIEKIKAEAEEKE
jgi:hypothetical protein